jgi:hypothetical protein
MPPPQPPVYFETIRREAAARWDKREADPEEASVWKLLFRQVQSPRHVVSELLQNADDAKASEAWIRVDETGTFVFEHNGTDFNEEQFRSLCRFGYSNKRSLFTIGFRGIGFKSTFSLGSPVSVQTPTLSVEFHQQRFTQPSWVSTETPPGGLTRISVHIADQHRRDEIEKNFRDWIDSPLSLLFFRNIHCIHIAGTTLRWQTKGTGPVRNSEWVDFEGHELNRYLIIRSDPEPFPEDALEEIRHERDSFGEEQEFPPCSIEMVLGHEGGLFVVLPTGGNTGLPFSANAPFMLTPDREHIKTPAISPVNRWLLDRVGQIAAHAMLDWLGNMNLSTAERAQAYEWMPASDPDDDSPDLRIGALARKAFDQTISGKDVLLAEDGSVVPAGKAIMLPAVALETWSAAEASKFLDKEARPALCQHIATQQRQKLFKRSLVERIENKDLISALSRACPPLPDDWKNLHALWKFLQSQYSSSRSAYGLPQLQSLRILPASGDKTLHHAGDVIRLTTRSEHCHSDKDWEFLTSRLTVVDAEWLRFISEADRAAIEGSASKAEQPQDPAAKLLKQLDMDQSAGAARLLDRAAEALVDDSQSQALDWVRLAHIAAALNAKAGDHFRFVTRDGEFRAIAHCVLHDLDGALELLLPDSYADAHVLHSSYSDLTESCTQSEWEKWSTSDQSGLSDLPPIEPTTERFETSQQFEVRLSTLQEVGSLAYKYRSGRYYTYQSYYLTDYDFPAEVVKHWLSLPEESGVWSLVARRLLLGYASRWGKFIGVVGEQTATGGGSPAKIGGIRCHAAWLRRLRSRQCLPDRRGVLKAPTDLVRLTHETEALLEVAPFVDTKLDNEHTRPMLDALGVASKPDGPDRLLKSLGALKLAPSPPLAEVEKWYRRLDQFTAACSKTDLESISASFTENELVLSQDGDWLAPSAVFLDADDADAPGVPLVMASVKDRRLWERLNVASRPTVDSAIAWLMELPPGKITDKNTQKRVEAMLKRHPVKIWTEVKHWLDLSGRWAQVSGLDHAIDSRQRVAFSHLHEWVKQRVADLRLLLPEVVADKTFSGLLPLEDSVEERILMDLSTGTPAAELPWLTAFGESVSRVNLDDEAKTASARAVGRRLMVARIRSLPSIQVTPYFEDKPAGTARQQDLAWTEEGIFAVPLAAARLARLLPEHLGRSMPTDSLREALIYCYDRPVPDVTRYMAENFDLEEVYSEPSTGEQPPSEEQNEHPPDSPPADPVLPPPPVSPDSPPPDAPESPPEGDADEPQPEQPAGDKPAKPRKPSGPSLMERFALARGFHREGEVFVHPDGSRLVKDVEGGFGWCLNGTSGGKTRHLRAVDACLERQAIEIPHETWDAIERAPEAHSLVLVDAQGVPTEVFGADLCRMKNDGVVSIFPASYRLRRT